MPFEPLPVVTAALAGLYALPDFNTFFLYLFDLLWTAAIRQ